MSVRRLFDFGDPAIRAVMGVVAAIAIGWAGAHAAPVDDTTAAVTAAFQRYDEGWRTYDVDKVADAFASDFEWTNEVGLRFEDKARLEAFLRHVFANPAFRAGKPGPLVIRSIRLVGPDVAVVSSSEETDGQRDSLIGNAVPVLHTNELTVMQRQHDRWLIVSDLTSDESHGI